MAKPNPPSGYRKTRNTSGSKLAEYLGTGKELLTSEVPTLRAALRQALLIQKEQLIKEEKDKRNIPVKDIMQETARRVMDQWLLSSHLFVPPVTVTELALTIRLENAWNKYTLIAKDKASKQVKSTWEPRLDRLLDITVCHCPIYLCSDPASPCLGKECKVSGGAHITCSCVKQVKLPTQELQWIHSQRNKVGEYSTMSIGGGDMVENLRQIKQLKRKQKEAQIPVNQRIKREKEIKIMSEKFEVPDSMESDESMESNNLPILPSFSHSEAETQPRDRGDCVGSEERMIQIATMNPIYESVITVEEDEDGPCVPETDDSVTLLTPELWSHHLAVMNPVPIEEAAKKRREDVGRRNLMPIPHTARASLRYQQSATETAAVGTGLIMDLIAAGYLSREMSFLALDKSKVQRWRNKVMSEASSAADILCTEEDILGIYFDSRKDITKFMDIDPVTGHYHPRMKNENHVSVTSEPDGNYRYHFTPDEPVGPYKPAYMEALGLYNWMVPHKIDKSLLVLGGDSTNSNSGWKGGTLVWVEKLCGEKKFWMICMLHTNELLIKHLITKLDGKSSSKEGWSGPIGKLLPQVNDMERRYTFPPIPGLTDLLHIPSDIVSRMSHDSSLFYQLGVAVRTGVLSRRLGSMKCGGLSHARWINTGTALLLLYVSKHDLSPELEERLNLLVTFTVQVYHQMFFQIKVLHTLDQGPRHVLLTLTLVRQ